MLIKSATVLKDLLLKIKGTSRLCLTERVLMRICEKKSVKKKIVWNRNAAKWTFKCSYIKKYPFLCGMLKYEPRYEKTGFLHMLKQTQISFTVTAKLISAFAFTSQIVQSLFFLKLKFPASSHLLWLYSPVCIRPGWKPQRPVFSCRSSYHMEIDSQINLAIMHAMMFLLTGIQYCQSVNLLWPITIECASSL